MTSEKMKTLFFAVIVATYVIVIDATVNEDGPSVQMECTELGVKATWNRTDFGSGNVTSVRWNDPSCTGYTNNGTFFSAMTNFSSCQSVITQHNDTIVQENTVRLHVVYSNGVIQRDTVFNYLLRCSMHRYVFTPVGASYNVTESRQVTAVNKTGSANFDIRMDIYTDSTFTTKLVNPTVASFDPIYVGVEKIYQNELFNFVTQECFATPTLNRDANRYTYYGDKCPTDPTFQTIAYTDRVFQYKIDAFKFRQFSNEVYLHCRLAMCKNASTAVTCQRGNCGSRKRRAVEADEAEEIEIVEVVTELTIQQQLDFNLVTCRTTTCTSYSSCYDFNPPICRCGMGYVLNTETNLCSHERTFVIQGLKFNMEFRDAYSDPYSRSFIELAMRIEKQLDFLVRQTNESSIAGMKVIAARKGSVLVDVQVIYKASSSEDEAYATFLKAVTGSSPANVPDPLPIQPNLTVTIEKNATPRPTTVKPAAPLPSTSASSPSLTLILCVAIPSVFVVVILGYMIVERKKICCPEKAVVA